MRHYRALGLTIASEIPLSGLCPGEARSGVDIRVVRERVSPSCTWFHHWRFGRRAPCVSFGRTARGVLVRFQDLAEFEVSESGGVVWCDPAGVPANTLAHLVADQVLPLALSQRGQLVLHASAVRLPGAGVVAFAGRTGRGKSTLAAALSANGAELVSDDCLRIGERDGEVEAVASYPGLRMWPDTIDALSSGAATPVAHYSAKRRVIDSQPSIAPGPHRLGVVFLLSARHPRGSPTALRRVLARDRFIALARHTFQMDVHDAGRLAASFSRLSALVARVPIARLGVVHSLAALPAVAEAIAGHARALASQPPQ